MNSQGRGSPKSFAPRMIIPTDEGVPMSISPDARAMTPMEGVLESFENNEGHLHTIIDELHYLLTKIRGPVPRNVPVTKEACLEEQGGLISKMDQHSNTVRQQASALSDLVRELQSII